MDAKEKMRVLSQAVDAINSRLDCLSNMSIFLDEFRYKTVLKEAIEESTKDLEKLKHLRELIWYAKIAIFLGIGNIITMYWLAH